MNRRVSRIAQALCNSHEPITIADLSTEFEVTQRTIRNDLREISDLLEQNGASRITFESGGLIVAPKDLSQLLQSAFPENFYAYKLSPEERAGVTAVILVSAPSYVTMAEIAERLFVSRATIIKDLDSIREILQKGNLELSSRANKGLSVTGKESDKRFFLMRTLRGDLSQESDAISRLTSVQAGDRVMLQKILSEQEHTHETFLTDDSFQDILLYLGIMINRNLQGEFLEPQPYFDNSERYLMAQDILRYVTQYCGVRTTEHDITALCVLLEQARYIRQRSFERDAVKIQMITRQFIAAISEELEINLNNDYEFFENLSNHISSVFSAPPADYPEQAVIEEVLEESADIVDAVHRRLPVIARYVEREITEMEIDYIAIHVCAAIERKKNKEIAFHVIVVCHAGIATSRLLMEKLKKHFNFQIVDIVPAHEVKFIPEGKADFVISTVPLRNCKLEYVVVSPSFNDSDYIRVGNKIDALRNSRHLPSRVQDRGISPKGVIDCIQPLVYDAVPEQAPELMKKIRRAVRNHFNQTAGAEAEIFSPYLHHLLPPDHIELDVECADWRDAIRKSAQKLMEWGYIEKRYVDAMIANVEENGPYIVLSKGFAVPHEGLEQGSVRVGMYLIRLKTPVPFEAEEFDPVEFVCCLSAVDHKTHLKAFFNLVNMLQNDEFKKLLRECETPAEAASVIERYEYAILG